MHTLNFDGACQGNPGPIGIGVSLCSENGNEIDSYCAFMGSGTNNRAEYLALLAALEMARKHKLSRFKVIGDSQLVIKQVKGIYRCNKGDLVPLRDKAVELAKGFTHVEFEWVKREFNQRADELSKIGLNMAPSSTTSALPSNEAQLGLDFDADYDETHLAAHYHPGIGFSVIEDGQLYAVNLSPLACSCGQGNTGRCKHIQFVFDLAKKQRNRR
jgi:ribonuclease HI